MDILSKACKPDSFELHNSLQLSFTNIRDLCSNFVDCESFHESNSPDILALCETNLDDSVNSGNFSVRSYLPLIRKDSSTHTHGLAVYVKEGLPFTRNLSLENSEDSYLCFRLALLHSVSYFFFLYRSPSSALSSVFDSISSNIDQVLSINPSANVFVFGDFNVYHKDWLTSSGGIDLPAELCYNFSISNHRQEMILLRWLTFLLGSQTVILIVLLFWTYFFLLMVVYANKTKESRKQLGPRNFWRVANRVLNKGKSAIPPLFKGSEVLSSVPDKAKLFAENFSKNSNLDDSGISTCFPFYN